MAEPKDDPYGGLIKFCQITSSQESKLQTCPFAKEFGSFPDFSDSLASSSPETSQLDTIVMYSLPESDKANSSIDTSNSQENENFLTPPENHIPSSSSLQEGRQPLKPVTPGDTKGSDSVVAETMFDDDDDDWMVNNEVSVNLGKGDKNLGFSGTENLVSRNKDTEGKCIDFDTLGEPVAVNGNGDFKEIEKFRYDGPSNGVNNPFKKRGRDLPVSIRGIEDDKKGGESNRYVKVKKACWEDIVNSLEIIFGKVNDDDDDDCEGNDLLEVAKRRGITFPKPRWM